MKNKILYLGLGLLLLLAMYKTRIQTIDPETLRPIQSLETLDGEKYFPAFDPAKYPLRVNYDKITYSYFQGQITEERVSYPLSFSALNTDQGPVILTLPIKDFRNIFDQGKLDKVSLESTYLAVLAHEGFHCHQMEKGLDDDNQAGLKAEDQTYKEFLEILNRLDEDQAYQDLYMKELKALLAYRDQGQKQAYTKAYQDLKAYLKKTLGPEKYSLYWENSRNLQLVEGTARYVENLVNLDLGQRPNGFYKSFSQGTEKFYLLGSLKTEILAKEDKLGLIKFDLSLGLDDLME
ncbi:MAG: hypothetical protein Q4E36_02610 [Bacillota bacterium]|nr:hypothetical protein [Bacillota bacterium]